MDFNNKAKLLTTIVGLAVLSMVLTPIFVAAQTNTTDQSSTGDTGMTDQDPFNGSGTGASEDTGDEASTSDPFAGTEQDTNGAGTTADNTEGSFVGETGPETTNQTQDDTGTQMPGRSPDDSIAQQETMDDSEQQPSIGASPEATTISESGTFSTSTTMSPTTDSQVQVTVEGNGVTADELRIDSQLEGGLVTVTIDGTISAATGNATTPTTPEIPPTQNGNQTATDETDTEDDTTIPGLDTQQDNGTAQREDPDSPFGAAPQDEQPDTMTEDAFDTGTETETQTNGAQTGTQLNEFGTEDQTGAQDGNNDTESGTSTLGQTMTGQQSDMQESTDGSMTNGTMTTQSDDDMQESTDGSMTNGTMTTQSDDTMTSPDNQGGLATGTTTPETGTTQFDETGTTTADDTMPPEAEEALTTDAIGDTQGTTGQTGTSTLGDLETTDDADLAGTTGTSTTTQTPRTSTFDNLGQMTGQFPKPNTSGGFESEVKLSVAPGSEITITLSGHGLAAQGLNIDQRMTENGTFQVSIEATFMVNTISAIQPNPNQTGVFPAVPGQFEGTTTPTTPTTPDTTESTTEFETEPTTGVTPSRTAIVTVTPSSGATGDEFNIEGRGFTANDSITITFEDQTLETTESVTADANGSFTTSATVPEGVNGAFNVIVAEDQSGNSGQAVFIKTGISSQTTTPGQESPTQQQDDDIADTPETGTQTGAQDDTQLDTETETQTNGTQTDTGAQTGTQTSTDNDDQTGTQNGIGTGTETDTQTTPGTTTDSGNQTDTTTDNTGETENDENGSIFDDLFGN